MSGNVWELTEDCWNENYNGAPTDGSAWTAGTCFRRVARGGGWTLNPVSLQAAFRNWYSTANLGSFIGFRVARDN